MSINTILKDTMSSLANAESTVPGWRKFLDEYLKRRKDDEDLSDMAIQTYWFADYLAKRRRKALGVKFSETFYNLRSLDRPTNGRKAGMLSYSDGHTTHAMIFTMLKKRKRYSLGNESLTVKQTQPSIFVILSTKESKETQVCPNCGSESPTDECMNGCPYCGTKFNIKQYQNKISGESRGITSLEFKRLLIASIGITSLIIIIKQLIDNTFGNVVLNILIGLIIGLIFGLLPYMAMQLPLLIFVFFPRVVRDNRLSDYCKILRKNDPNMSAGEISSEFESRVRAFFLAGKDDNIHFVSKVEASDEYADVADAMIDSYNKLLTIPSQEYQTIRAHMTVQLVRVKDGKLTSEKLPFTADFTRNKETKTQALPDNEVFTCSSCAGAISILEGGHCRFCGNNTDLSKHGFTLQLMEPGWIEYTAPRA